MAAKLLVLQLCLAVGFISVVLAGHTQTSGEGGVQCGEVRCLNNDGMCVTDTHGNQTCECDPGYKKQVQGRGAIACYKKNKIWGMIRSEPIVDTYDGFHYPMNLPCRVLATKFTSRFKLIAGKPDYVGTCECEVYAWQRKHKGKFYPHGFDAACRLRRTDTDPHDVSGFSFRKYGIATSGVYDFYEEGALEFLPNGPWTNDTVKIKEVSETQRIITQCKYDTVNNIAEVEQKNCGLRVELRPFDTKRGRYQTLPNGVAWAINCANHPDLEEHDRSIVSGPKEHKGIPWYEQINAYELLTPEEIFLHRALVSDVEQNQPDASPECDALSDSAFMCDEEVKVKKAMDMCKWMLHAQPFIKCVDPTDNAHHILRLVRRCFDQACGTLTCYDFKQDLLALDPKCLLETMVQKVKKLKLWLDGDFC